MTTDLPKVSHRVSLTQEFVVVGFIVLLALLAAISWYGYTRLAQLTEQTQDLSSKTTVLQDKLLEATNLFVVALNREQQAVGGVQDQVGSISGTVTTLQKLSQTDPQLLAKYSKVFFLSENYAPARLDNIPSQYEYDATKQLQVIPEVLPFLQNMLDQAKNDNVPLYVDSAYRSFNTQVALKEQYKLTYGAGTANSFSADQGYSEHQLGTTVDLITTGTGGSLLADGTPGFIWLQNNAYRYGFILSYPKNNGYYIFEPWHWRFVGVKLATDLHNQNTYFYNMDQRTIDTYLISLFD